MNRPDILKSAHNQWGLSRASGNEVTLDSREICDIFEMYYGEPIFSISRKAFLSKVLPEPFTFEIPKLGLVNNKEVEIIIKGYWMPWLRKEFDWEKTLDLVPYMLIPLEGNLDHLVPFIPDPTTGYITVYMTDKTPPKVRYRWYWNNNKAQAQEEKKMMWIIGDNAPDASGKIRSPLASLLNIYRSMLKLRKAQDIASTQAARPVHIIERNPSLKTATDDGLIRHVADFDRAAGIGQARRERMQQAQMRVKQAELYRNFNKIEESNRQKSTIQQTLWTDTPAEMLEEMDAGFSNRVVTMEEHCKYTTAARPQLVADYNKAELQFNTMAAAVVDFALELLTPTGTARSQNIAGAQQYENERIREQSSRFSSILRPAIILAYKKQLQSIMDRENNWRLSRFQGNTANVDLLYPELDVVINLSNTSVTTDDDMIKYWQHGFISQETAASHILKNKNIPLELMSLTKWPDNFPKERLVKGTVGVAGENVKKKNTISQSKSEETKKPPKKKRTGEKKSEGGGGHTKKKKGDDEVEIEMQK